MDVAQETIIAKTVHVAPYVSGGGTVIMGLSQEQWMVAGVIVGIVCTIISTAVNWWYRHSRYDRN